MLVYADGRASGTIGGGEMEARVVAEALAALEDGRPRLIPYSLVDPQRGDPGVCGGEVEIYVEPYGHRTSVYVIGCGHVGRAVVQLAHWLGYRVVAYDDRPELISPELVPDADVRLSGPIAEALAAAPVDRRSYLVVVTRNVLVDRELLPALLATDAAYIGVIGSRRRWEETTRLLREDGVPEAALRRIRSPIGLELRAETPAEIALSIMAEIVQTRAALRQQGHIGIAVEERQSKPSRIVIDPICGMEVDLATARHTLEVDGETLGFCCAGCLQQYRERLAS
jgi:xanthine dehydrogenase accessory factor